ncbi:MAG: hypothetical protein ACI4P1_00595 [Erysipelotrichaceae bacterium]|nr:hypothetical protein [Bacillota bacterium]MDY3091512.1 hypothetical protein [Erysipelotrichaceae bacterium]
MKRFYWLEVCSLFTSYILLINKMELLSLIVSLISLVFLSLFIKKINIYRLCFVSISVLCFSMILSENGGLYALYKYLNLVIISISVHLGVLYEILNTENNFSKAFKPYCFMLVMSLLFFSIGIIMSDCAIFDVSYPYGILSLFAIIGIIFVPYLITVTVSFISHEYNY